MKLTDLPAVGQPLAAGIFAGLTTTKAGAHCAVILLTDKPEGLLTWKKAMNWAEKLDAALPTRADSALLFANLKDQFDPHWHWTSEELDGSSAWHQGFGYGLQGNVHKSFEGRARAVRLIPLKD